MRFSGTHSPIALAFGLAAAMSSTAQAQEVASGAAPVAEDEDPLGVIIVTANKRAENVQDVAAAVTAFGSDSVDSLGWEDPVDVSAQIPNMQVQQPFGEVQPIFSVRGISMSDYNQNQASPVGVYADEGYLGATYTHGLSMFDLERIEVLRGPQGTLYGKNTTGGAINLITRSPDPDGGVNGYINVGYGNFDAKSGSAAINLPIAEGVMAARIAVNFKKDDGYWENQIGPDLAQTDFWSARLGLAINPSDRLSLVAKITRSESDGRSNTPPRIEGRIPTPFGNVNIAGFDSADSKGTYTGSVDVADAVEIDMTNLNVRATYEGDNFEIVSVTNWYESSFNQPQDVDGGPTNLASIDWLADTDSFAQDLRFVSNFGGSFNFIAGLYYANEDTDLDVDNTLFDSPLPVLQIGNPALATLVGNGAFGTASRDIDVIKKSYAAYVNAEIDLTDRLGLDVGLRYTIDKNTRDRFNVSRLATDGTPIGSWVPNNNPLFGQGTAIGGAGGLDAAFIPPGAAPLCLPAPTPFCATGVYTNGSFTDASVPSRSVTDKEWSGKITLNYQAADDVLVYGSYSRGFRAGSWNGGLFYADNANDNGAFASPEFLDAFELGFKSEFFGRSLRLNGGIFYYDYKDQQFINQVGISGLLVNAGGAEMLGAELELLWAAADGLTLQAGLGWLDSEYTELDLADLSTPDTSDTIDLSGNQLLGAPELTLNFAADYEHEIGDSALVKLHVDGNYTSDQWFSAYNDALNYGAIRQDGYWLFNAKATVANIEETIALSLWVKNLADKNYDVFAINLQGGFGFDYFIEGRPRTYGAELSFKF